MFDAQPTASERQRENLSSRLRREFGLALPEDEEARPPTESAGTLAAPPAGLPGPPAPHDPRAAHGPLDPAPTASEPLAAYSVAEPSYEGQLHTQVSIEPVNVDGVRSAHYNGGFRGWTSDTKIPKWGHRGA